MNMEEKTVIAAIYFKVMGLLCYLSHQETARMFRRALTRASIKLKYSQGFNPHPKMSLPLPRSVGMASECELLVVSILTTEQTADCGNKILQQLAPHLPADINIFNIDIYEDTTKFEPIEVKYIIPVELTGANRPKLEAVCQELNSAKSFEIDRFSHKSGKIKRVNVADFLKCARVIDEGIEVTACFVSGSSLKLDEMPLIFGLDKESITAPIVRKFVQWQRK